MSSTMTPVDLAERTLQRLNQAATDLRLTLSGRPLFALGAIGDPDDKDTFIIEINIAEFEDYVVLANKLERVAETQTRRPVTPGVHPDQLAWDFDGA